MAGKKCGAWESWMRSISSRWKTCSRYTKSRCQSVSLGFSSTQTRGSRSDSGFSYILSTSSILKIYSSSNFPTHHIFFPPWLEVMAFQQNPDGLSAHARNKFALDNFLGQKPHRPAYPPLWRRRADHGDNALLLLLIQTCCLARTRRIKQRAL